MGKRINFNKSYVTLLSLALMVGALITALLIKTYPLFSAKALYFCQQFISNTLFRIPHSLPGALIFSVWAIASLGLISFAIQLVRTYLLLRKTVSKRVPLNKRLQRIACSLGLHNRLQLVKDKNLYSFCFGLFRPQIIISQELVESLTDKELEAVLIHEQAHLINRDPLKILLGKTIASTFFFLPIFHELYRNIEATNELIADRWTIEIQKDAKFLRGALRKIIAQPQAQLNLATVPAIFHPEHIEIRVKQLANSKIKHKLSLSYTSVITGVAFMIVSFFVLQTPVDAFHMEDSQEPSFFLCSVDNSCREQCHHNASMSTMTAPEQLFTPASSHLAPKYEAPSY